MATPTIRWSIYKITCAASGKSYIGLTKLRISLRWQGHLSTARRGAPVAIARAIRKYGEVAFTMETIAQAASFEAAAIIERVLIAEHGTMHPGGYNLTTGGEATFGREVGAEAKSRMSEAAKRRERKPDTPETKEKKRAARIKLLSERPDLRLAISAAQKGRKKSEAERAKHSRSMKARAAANPEWYKRLSDIGRKARWG